MDRIKKIFFLNKKKGSITAVLIASGVMGVSFVALLGYMGGMSTQMKEVTQRHSVSFDIHMDILSNLRGLLIETKLDQDGNKQAQNRWGVCSLIKSPGKAHGVDLIEMKLSSGLVGRAADSFSQSRWKAFFDQSEYKIASDDNCRSMGPEFATFSSGYFGYCFKYVGKQSEAANEIYIIARIVPKKFPNFEEINLNVSNELDVKLVTFELQTIVGIKMGEQMVLAKYHSMVWSNEIVECEVQVRGKWINVQFSGTGVGRLSDRFVVNHPFFSSQLSSCSEVEFGEIPSDIIMGGYFPSGNMIAGDHSKNKKIACRKNIYRCPGESGQDTDYFDQLIFKMDVVNNYGGLLSFNNVNFTLLNSSDKEVDSTENGKIDTLTVEVVSTGGDFEANTDIDPDLQLQAGLDIFNFVLKDKASGSLVNMCKSVCSGNTHYPSVSMGFTHAPSEQACTYSRNYEEAEYHIGCNVCHSKMCHKIGMGTFGPIRDENGLQGLVDEPLDGTIPECALKKSISYDLPSISSGTGDCVAMRATDMDSFKNFASAQYEYQNCFTSLPVLCFAYGHYLPAMTISSPGSNPTIVTSNFEGAQEACYKMGRELIEKAKLANYFRRFWPGISNRTVESVVTDLTALGLSSLGSNHFDYVNNATRGLFIAPSYNISTLSNRLSQGNNSYLQKFIDSSHSKLWVAMEKDAGSQLIGSIPQASKATSPFSVFTRREFPARALILKDTNSISDSGTDTVLTYNIRYKGVYNVSSSGSNKALCRKGSGDFILSNSTILANAPTACRSADANARFIPPVSSLEWAKAMALLNPNSEMYPFPSPGNFSGAGYSPSRSVSAPVAWVALTKKWSGSFAKSWRLNKAYFPDSDSVFKTESIPSASANYMGIIDYKGKPVTPLMTLSTFLNFNFSVFKKACFNDESNGQVVLKASVAADESCASGQTEVTKDNLKMTSIRFMSDWVQTNKSGAFIIDKRLVDQAVTQAKKKKCRNNCRSAKVSCDDGCDTYYNNCRLFCRVNPVGSPFLASCMRACARTRDSCKASCSSTFTSCKSDCNTTYNTNGHAHIWFQ